MSTTRPLIALAWISLILLALAGCSSTTTAKLPQDGKKMKTIFDEHQAHTGKQSANHNPNLRPQRPIQDDDADLEGYTRTASNEIKQLFPVLPNPTLIMYVDPHLAVNGTPIPGYSTTIPMYLRVQYALPGEIPLQ